MKRRQATPEGLARHARRPERWSEWAALGYAAARPMGRVAAREGWLTLEAAAARLDVSPTVVRTLITRGVLPAKQVVATAPWVIQAQDLSRDPVQHYVAAVHRGRRSPRIADVAQLTLTDSST